RPALGTHRQLSTLVLLFAACATGCGDDRESTDPDAGMAGDAAEDGDAEPSLPTAGLELGTGSLDSVDLVSLYEPDGERSATDLALDPATGTLWVVLRERAEAGECTMRVTTGCGTLEGSTVEI